MNDFDLLCRPRLQRSYPTGFIRGVLLGIVAGAIITYFLVC